MFLSDKQIKDYQNDGVLIIKDIFKDWIEPLKKNKSAVIKFLFTTGFQTRFI